MGYVNEVIVWLMGELVEDGMSMNSILDGLEKMFLLGRKLYVDFSYDNFMVSVYVVLGLYNYMMDLLVGRKVVLGDVGGFLVVWIVFFGVRMYVEKMWCEKKVEELVRVVVNDRVVRLRGCGGDEYWRCEVGKFVESFLFVRLGGLWDVCFI